MLRAFYRSFDGLLVLNREQREWLASDAMGIPPERLHATAHWVDPIFGPQPVLREELVPGLKKGEKVVLFAGRLSKEKGVLELPALMQDIRRRLPNVRLVVAGCGPAEERLREELPDATFTGWVTQAELARHFAGADVMVLPSRFDTFGCAVLEALSCGLPVVAYRVKGPADIIVDGDCGFLADDIEELAQKAVRILSDADLQGAMSAAALERAAAYRPEVILADLLHDLGLDAEGERFEAPTPEEELFRVAI
jgi:glycosyltransferase involved in cell wall biosynthesis